jgi:hypothetical protein
MLGFMIGLPFGAGLTLLTLLLSGALPWTSFGGVG